MTKNIPVYINLVNEDEYTHISLGVKPNTLCKKEGVTSAVQVEEIRSSIAQIDSKGICDKCQSVWKEIEDEITIEPIVDCDRCGTNYGVSVARVVNHMQRGEVPVCKVCFEELQVSPNSGVSSSYEDAEEYYPINVSRDVCVQDLDIEQT